MENKESWITKIILISFVSIIFYSISKDPTRFEVMYKTNKQTGGFRSPIEIKGFHMPLFPRTQDRNLTKLIDTT